MSYRTTGHPSHLRHQSLSATASTQSTALQQRINEKRAELENLKQLRDLSAGLAGQMEQLQDKIATLSNGTEAIAAVLSNWHNVLRAINMASAKIPIPKTADANEPELPQTLVRIPVQHAEQIQAHADETKE